VTEAAGGPIGPGTELDGFVIEAVLGRGGMGVVYRARQRRPARMVALKVIAPDVAHDPEFRARFERESEIAAQIEHPNVIPVHAVGEADGIVYIAMRLVDGTDMASLLAGLGRLEPTRAATIVDQVAQALDAAHARGLVHRDVKPANILIARSSSSEHVYLSDFGLSRHVEASHGVTRSGAFIGTIDYVAPEQVRGERVDARTDVYSLGCVLYRALTGQVPFPLDNDLAKLFAHGSQDPPVPSEYVPDLPLAFDAILPRALAKSPDDRYQSAGDLGRAAVAAAGGGAVPRAERTVAVGAAAPADAQTRTQLPTRPQGAVRSPRWWGPIAAASALAALLAVVVVVLLANGRSSPHASSSTAGSLGAVQGQTVSPLRDEQIVQTKDLSVPQGYGYRVVIATIKAPLGASSSTIIPYYLTLSARHGSDPLQTVQRLKLPWTFTTSSIIAQFRVDPNPDGSLNVGLSWFVKKGDTADQTHYLSLTPQGIDINS
jgi:serine/threonine protein kinase